METASRGRHLLLGIGIEVKTTPYLTLGMCLPLDTVQPWLCLLLTTVCYGIITCDGPRKGLAPHNLCKYAKIRVNCTALRATGSCYARTMVTRSTGQSAAQVAVDGNAIRLPGNGTSPSKVHQGHGAVFREARIRSRQTPSQTPPPDIQYPTQLFLPVSHPTFSPSAPIQRAPVLHRRHQRTREPRRNMGDHRHDGHLARIGRARQLFADTLCNDSITGCYEGRTPSC